MSAFLKVAEAAKMANVKVDAYYRYAKNGQIPAVRVGKVGVRVPQGALQRFLQGEVVDRKFFLDPERPVRRAPRKQRAGGD